MGLYFMGLITAGIFTGVLVAVALAPQSVKEKFTEFLWNPEGDE